MADEDVLIGMLEDDETTDMDNEVIENNESYEESEEVSEGYEEEDSESVEDDDLYDYEDFDIPEYFPEELIPNDFEDEKAELEWYRDKYYDVIDYHRTEDFGKAAAARHKELLVEAAQEIEGLKDFYNELKENPTIALKKYAQEYLAKEGYSTIISSKEGKEYIDRQMKKKFGDNYLDKYSEAEAVNNPESLSAKMYAEDKRLLDQLQSLNQKATQKEIITPDVIQERINQQYKEHFEGKVEREAFDEFVQKASQTTLNLKQVYAAMNIKEIIAEADKRGYERGREEFKNKVKKAGSTPTKTSLPKKTSRKLNNDLDLLLSNR